MDLKDAFDYQGAAKKALKNGEIKGTFTISLRRLGEQDAPRDLIKALDQEFSGLRIMAELVIKEAMKIIDEEKK